MVQGLPVLSCPQHLHLCLIVRVTQGQLYQKAVHLRVRKQVCAGGADAVLGGDYEEGTLQGMRFPVHGDLLFLHGLQEGRLGLACPAVDLIREQKIHFGQRPRVIDEVAGGFVHHGKAREIRGQHVRGELHPVKGEPQGFADGKGKGGLADPRHVVQEHMAVGQHGGEDHVDGVLLA